MKLVVASTFNGIGGFFEVALRLQDQGVLSGFIFPEE